MKNEAAYQMLRKTGLVVRATEEKTYFDECCYTNRSVKLVINKGEIINYNEIYIQHVTKERNRQNTGERKEKEYMITSKWENEKQKEKNLP